MLSYLSVLSAYLKKTTSLPKKAGGYDLILFNTDMRNRTRLFCCCFWNGCLYFCLFFFFLFIITGFGLVDHALSTKTEVSLDTVKEQKWDMWAVGSCVRADGPISYATGCPRCRDRRPDWDADRYCALNLKERIFKKTGRFSSRCFFVLLFFVPRREQTCEEMSEKMIEMEGVAGECEKKVWCQM